MADCGEISWERILGRQESDLVQACGLQSREPGMRIDYALVAEDSQTSFPPSLAPSLPPLPAPLSIVLC